MKKPSKKTSEKHVAFLKQGVTAWNAWRGENLDIRPDLSGADLSEANLTSAGPTSAGPTSEAQLSSRRTSAMHHAHPLDP